MSDHAKYQALDNIALATAVKRVNEHLLAVADDCLTLPEFYEAVGDTMVWLNTVFPAADRAVVSA